MKSFRQEAVSGVFWISIGSAGQQFANFIVSLFLARILLPTDFGPVAIVTGIIAILQVFSDMGVSVSLVQRPDISQSVIDSAFCATVSATLLIFAALFLLADRFAIFFASPILSELIKIAAFWYLFRGTFSLYNCLLLRAMRYREIGLLNLVGIITFGTVSVSMALTGLGARSIVWGQMVASGVLLGLGVLRTGYLPHGSGSIKEMKELLGFGLWVSAGRAIGSVYSYNDSFVVGKLLNVGLLGEYYVAQKLVMVVPRTIRGILDQVMFPIYSRWQNDTRRIEQAYWETFSYSVLLTVPIACLLFLLADLIVPILLGPQWAGTVPLLRIMSVYVFALSFGGSVFGSVIYATGKPQAAVFENLFGMILLPVCVIIGSMWGLRGVAWGFAVSGVLSTAFGQLLLRMLLGFSTGRLLTEIPKPLLANLPAFVSVFLLLKVLPKDSLYQQISDIAAATAVWLLIYFIFLSLFLPEKLRDILALIGFSPSRLHISAIPLPSQWHETGCAMANTARKIKMALSLLSHRRVGTFFEISRRELSSEETSYAFRRDLTIPFEPHTATVPITLMPFEKGDNPLLPFDDIRQKTTILKERLPLDGAIKAGIPSVIYVAVTPDGSPCFLQWLIASDGNDRLNLYYKGYFPPLAKNEVLLEGAFVLERHRRKGIMTSAMSKVAERAMAMGARWAITYVDASNLPSIRGCLACGFHPFMKRKSVWRAFRRSLSFTLLYDDERRRLETRWQER